MIGALLIWAGFEIGILAPAEFLLAVFLLLTGSLVIIYGD
jgi:hypothetical protein